MNDYTKHNEPVGRPTAKIYRFPERRALMKPAPENAKLKSCPWENGWYHEEAIEDEQPKPLAGPAA